MPRGKSRIDHIVAIPLHGVCVRKDSSPRDNRLRITSLTSPSFTGGSQRTVTRDPDLAFDYLEHPCRIGGAIMILYSTEREWFENVHPVDFVPIVAASLGHTIIESSNNQGEGKNQD